MASDGRLVDLDGPPGGRPKLSGQINKGGGRSSRAALEQNDFDGVYKRVGPQLAFFIIGVHTLALKSPRFMHRLQSTRNSKGAASTKSTASRMLCAVPEMPRKAGSDQGATCAQRTRKRHETQRSVADLWRRTTPRGVAARRGGRAAELNPRALGSRDVGSKFLSFAVDEHGSACTICHGSLHRRQCAKQPSQPVGTILLFAVY